jgi:hypothetical protein
MPIVFASQMRTKMASIELGSTPANQLSSLRPAIDARRPSKVSGSCV